MKTKVHRKLSITRETLRLLDDKNLTNVAGGDTTTDSLKCSTASQDVCSGCAGCRTVP
jgi:hypothetical protein